MHRFQRHGLIVGFACMATLQLQSCAQEVGVSIADGVALMTAAYCKAPPMLRAELRQVIDANAKPHQIRVECAADAL